MRIIESDRAITKIKCHDEDENIRITWNWPQDISQVYIFADKELTSGKLFTLHEYKKRGGCILKKPVGVSTYYIYPFLREGGEDILCAQPQGENQVSYTRKTIISLKMSQKSSINSPYKNYKITLAAENFTPPDIIRYVKNGMEYLIGEPLTENPLTRIIRTQKNESLDIYISEENSNLYTLGIVRK
ncbi:MAG: hypothetical protein FWF81_04085 [Defluviitaleaceae bacterium]|nr:hypothetical protein [Defluviitaleaceae bacterium]